MKRHLLFTLFLEMPGILICVVGGIATVFSGAAALGGTRFPEPGRLAAIGGAAAVFLAGYGMMTAGDLLGGGERTRITSEQLPKLLLAELLLLASGGLVICALVAVPIHALGGRRPGAAACIILAITAAWGFKRALDRLAYVRAKWGQPRRWQSFPDD